MRENEIKIQMNRVRQQIETHAMAAYDLLPSVLVPYSINSLENELKWLKKSYDSKDWQQVFYRLKGFHTANDFSKELCTHLHELDQLFNHYDILGLTAILNGFTDEEKTIVGECLNASAYGPFFPDWEISLIFGPEKNEIIKIADAWPNINPQNTTALIVIGGAFNNLLGYPHHKDEDWPRYISVSRNQLRLLFHKFKSLRTMTDHHDSGKAEYFNNLW